MQFSKEEKAMWLENWKRSGESAWSYAKGNGLNPQTFTRWTKPKDKQSLIEVPKQVFQSTLLMQEMLIEKGEVKIHIPLEPFLGELHAIIKNLDK